MSDYKSGLYTYIHVNFSSSIPSKLLEKFATEVSRSSITAPGAIIPQVSRVIDRYCSFVSLSQTMYSLNMKSVYASLHRSTTTEKEIESMVDQIASGLMSLLVTCIKQVPIIRAPQNEAAGMVAERLNEKLSDLLKTPAGSDLFTTTGVSMDPTHAQRPLLVLLDRSMDISPSVLHEWSYNGLMTDLLGMTLNKVSIPKENKVYDVGDSFWKKIAHLPFPDAATAVNEHVNEFQKMRHHVVGGGGGNPSGDVTAMTSALPQVTEMKKIVDMHTTIATSLLNEIKRRNIDKFIEVENDLNVSKFFADIVDNPEMILEDKIRTAIGLIVKKPEAFGSGGGKIDQLIDKLEQQQQLSNSLSLINSVRYIKYVLSIKGSLGGQSGAATLSAPSGVVLPGVFGGLAEKVKSRSETLLAQGMKNLKNILPTNDNLMFTNLVAQLADQVANPITDSFSYLDPRRRNDSVRVRGSYRQVIICVIGGGSVMEYENLSSWGTKTGRTVVYGATDLPNGSQFIADLASLK